LVSELAAVGIFEVLTDSPDSIRAARELLYGRAIDLFEEMIQFWGQAKGLLAPVPQ
jgi:hypothetical protein